MFIQDSAQQISNILLQGEALYQNSVLLLQNRQYAEAYVLLAQALQENPEDASVLFNLGLCCLFAGKAEKALEYLDSGLEKLKTSGLQQDPQADRETTLALEAKEAQTDNYKQPMLSFEAETFPKRCRDRFLRLIFDACALTNNHVRAQQIADALRGKNYKNITDAMGQL